MPLYIRDDDVDALVEELMKATGAISKTEAVRSALQAQLAAIEARKPLLDRIRELQERTDAIGPVDPGFDQKKFFDELWRDA
jgi:antitoxin VapB